MITLRDAYLEISDHCFSRCATCATYHHPNTALTMNQFLVILGALKRLNCKKIRLTGKEPQAHPDLLCMLFETQNQGIDVDILSTLLGGLDRLAPMKYANISRVSLSSVGMNYHKYFGVSKWELFDECFKELVRYRSANGDITHVNYTIFEGNSSRDDIRDFIKYINTVTAAYGYDSIHVDFFHSLPLEPRRYNLQETQLCYVQELIWNAEFKHSPPIPPVDQCKAMSICNTANSRWYIKTDGSIYPCCMAGGELGQTLETSLCIGNILTEPLETLSDVATIPLRNLDNPICNSCTPKYFKGMPESFRK